MIKGFFYVAVAATLMGTLGTFGVILNQAGFTGFQVAAIRVLITAITLLALYPLVFKGSRNHIKENWKSLLAHSLAGVFGFSMFFFIATSYLGVTLGVALLYTAPIWVLILSFLFLKERAGIRRWFLAICSVSGVLLILGAGHGMQDLSIVGIAFGICSGISYGIYAVLGKSLLQRVNPNLLLFTSFTLATPLLFLFPQTWKGLAMLPDTMNFKVLLSFFAISWIGTILVFFLYIRGLSMISASTAAVITTIEPLVATMLAVLFLGEILPPIRYVGVAFIIISAALIGILEAKTGKVSA